MPTTKRPFPVIKRMPAPDNDLFAIFVPGEDYAMASYMPFDAASEAVKAFAINTDWTLSDLEYFIFGPEDEGPSCSLCDALGHGYPGGGPCPLEDRGGYEWDGEYGMAYR